MTERENVLRVIRRSGAPEWVPIAEDCFDFIVANDVIRERPPMGESGYDWFGCWWTYDPPTRGYYVDPAKPLVITDICQWKRQLRFPDLDKENWAAAKAYLGRLDRQKRLTVLNLESGIFERLHALMGFENALLAMCTEPEAVHDCMAAITDFRIRVVERIAEHFAPDMITSMDDYGTQKAPLLSLDMFRAQIKPHGARFGAALAACGILYEHHSCGKMDVFVGDLIEIGAQVIHGAHPVNDMEALERRFADQICFDGGLNTNGVTTLEDAGEEALRAEARRAIDLLAPYGNYILRARLGAAPPKNVDIIIDEARRYGAGYWIKN